VVPLGCFACGSISGVPIKLQLKECQTNWLQFRSFLLTVLDGERFNYIAKTCGINQLQEVIVENIALNSMKRKGMRGKN